jgi:predicted RNA-binding Zn-ribbon protein involved in translation (DUF1610 family)
MIDNDTTQHETIVYATTTVEAADEITDEELAEMYPDADHVKADHRVTGDVLAEIGDKPTTFVCPECGEGTWSARTINGTRYYRHHETEDCERDVRDQRDPATGSQMTLKKRLANTIACGLVAASAWVVLTATKTDLTINGEAATIPSTGTTVWGVVVLAFLFFVLLTAIPYLPGTMGRRL